MGTWKYPSIDRLKSSRGKEINKTGGGQRLSQTCEEDVGQAEQAGGSGGGDALFGALLRGWNRPKIDWASRFYPEIPALLGIFT